MKFSLKSQISLLLNGKSWSEYLTFSLNLFSTDRLVLFSQEGVGEPLFFQHYDSAYVPTLRLIHRCNKFQVLKYVLKLFLCLVPQILPSVQVDAGAIRSIINGADVMAPGLTSAQSRLPEGLKADMFVVIAVIVTFFFKLILF